MVSHDRVEAVSRKRVIRLMQEDGLKARVRKRFKLHKDAPISRLVQPLDQGEVVAIPPIGGLHHRCERRAA